MFITKKGLQRKIEDAVRKEREQIAQRMCMDDRMRSMAEDISNMRQQYHRTFRAMENRVRKLEGKPELEDCNERVYASMF